VSAPITGVTDEIRIIAADMCDVMYDEPGIGLAAPQLGEAIRLIVVDTEWNSDEEDAERNPIILVNPEIYERTDTLIWNEGCLSVPDFEADVERAAKIRLRATDLDGKDVDLYAEELQAVCFQHELDHLNGVLFIDHVSRLKRSMYVKRRQKQVRRELEESGVAS
jgi:peptide deformylase